jgi:cysteine desulfurase
MNEQIYLDYNASTPIAPEVLDAMRPFLVGHFGNPSSRHWAAGGAKAAIDTARAQVARLLGCNAGEIVFTSGGSEANNHAVKGLFLTAGGIGGHVITSAIEHPAVIEPCRFLERLGVTLTVVAVDGCGRVDPDDVRRAITPDTRLISIMHANNEVGTLQPIEAIGRLARERGILLHTDAAQSVGKVPVDAAALGVDLLTVAGHKLYAPKGVGALYIRNGVTLEPLVHGAGHESGRRAGTENVPYLVGLGAACALAEQWLPRQHEIRNLRDVFWNRLRERFGAKVVLNGHTVERLPNTLNVCFVGKVGAEILAALDGVAASTGSACHSGKIALSPVLRAMNVPPEVGMGAIRFSLGRATTAAEIDVVVDRLAKCVA